MIVCPGHQRPPKYWPTKANKVLVNRPSNKVLASSKHTKVWPNKLSIKTLADRPSYKVLAINKPTKVLILATQRLSKVHKGSCYLSPTRFTKVLAT